MMTTTTNAMTINLKDGNTAVEFELIPGNDVYVEYKRLGSDHGGGGSGCTAPSLYLHWEDLGEDIQERLKEVHARMVREIGEVFSLLNSGAE